ncbi:MAG: M56 family metallopeptidase [Lachnospiraceae bacterium]|nr:M56 family metallopeptidase [Lachnospiraceae bacterium]
MNWKELLITITLYSILVSAVCGNIMFLVWNICRKILSANGRLLEVNRLLRLNAAAYVFPVGVLRSVYKLFGFYNGRIVTVQLTAGSQRSVRIAFMLLLMIWLLGIMYYSIRLLYGRAQIDKALVFATEISGAETETLDKVRGINGYGKGVKVYKWPFSSTPMVVHGNRILLPQEIVDQQVLNICLAHEMNHIIARDLFWNSVCNMICLFQWFNPVVYKWRKEVCLWSEISCDIHSLKDLPGCSQKEYYSTVLQFCDLDKAAGNGVCLSDSVREIKERINYMKLFKDKKHFRALTVVLSIAGIVLMTQASVVSAEVIYGLDGELLNATLIEEQIEIDTAGIGGQELTEQIEQINMDQVEVLPVSDYSVLTGSNYVFTVSDAESGVVQKDNTGFNLNKGDVIRLIISSDDSNAVIDYGIITTDGLFRYVTYHSDPASQHDFTIDTAGTYYVAIRNQSANSLDISIIVWLL